MSAFNIPQTRPGQSAIRVIWFRVAAGVARKRLCVEMSLPGDRPATIAGVPGVALRWLDRTQEKVSGVSARTLWAPKTKGKRKGAANGRAFVRLP